MDMLEIGLVDPDIHGAPPDIREARPDIEEAAQPEIAITPPAEFMETPPDDLICQICCYVLREPHVTDCCGQHLCKSCLDSSVNLFTNIKACPYCREKNFKHLIYKPYQRKINELMVYCTNKSQGCSDILKFKDLEQHVAKANKAGCLYTTLECPNGCYTELLRKDMDEHLKEACPNRYVTCEHCDEEMMWRDLEDHYDGCGKYPVLCPRSCADGMFIREQLAEHEKQCPNVVVECPFQEAGCSDEITRAQLTNHLESNMADHLGKLMTAYSKLKSEFQSLKINYEKTQTNGKYISPNVGEEIICETYDEYYDGKKGEAQDGYCYEVSEKCNMMKSSVADYEYSYKSKGEERCVWS